MWEVSVLEKTIYLRMRNRVQVRPNRNVCLNDIAQIIAPVEELQALKNLHVHQLKETDGNIVVIDVMKVIRLITENMKDSEVQSIGPAQTIVEVISKKRRVSTM